MLQRNRNGDGKVRFRISEKTEDRWMTGKRPGIKLSVSF
jgi:hypothetical protein